MTDVLGECLSWGRGLCEVRTADNTVVTIHLADVVSGKPVPPRPSVRLRVPPGDVQRRALALFDDVAVEEYGEWLLRHGGTSLTGRTTKRGSSALACGDPGTSLAEAAAHVRRHYAERGLPALAQVVVGSDEERGMDALGWQDAGGHAEVLVAAASRVLRTLPAPPPEAELVEDGDRAVARIGEDARVRVALDGDWACLGDLWVTGARRRTGLARAVLAEALDWAASRGATTLHLAVEVDNAPALQLYGSLGFTVHHAYRFLAAD